jgi:hypothetical protein
VTEWGTWIVAGHFYAEPTNPAMCKAEGKTTALSQITFCETPNASTRQQMLREVFAPSGRKAELLGQLWRSTTGSVDKGLFALGDNL